MMVMIIASSLMMAVCMAVVGWGRRRDGLARWAVGLLLNAVGHFLLMLYGAVPNGVSIVPGNLLLSCVMVCMTAAIYQFQGRPVPWWLLVPAPVLITVFVAVFINDFPARVSFVGLVIGLQTLWGLSATLERRHATVGRGQWLLVTGFALEAAVLGSRALLALSDYHAAATILQSSVLQTFTFMSTFAVVLVSSMGFVFMSRDRADESNRVMATMDALTGVANRRSFIAALDRDVARAVRTRAPTALMMMDIDHFKSINDRYGHPVGDQVLCSVVNVVRQRARAQDLVGRYGGEEFMVLLPDTTLAGAEQLARELCKAVQESCCPVDGVDGPGISVTISIGVFGGQLDAGDGWDMLISAADRALYRAKSNGRNRVESEVSLRQPVALVGAA